MSWVQTPSHCFVARHESGDAIAAQRVLSDLEELRARLERLLGVAPADEVAVVIHGHPLALTLAAPWLPLARAVSVPAGRRYFAGWFQSSEIHVLSPARLVERASGVEGSREALLRSARHEYAHITIGLANPALPPPFSPRSFRRYLRLAWLCEGGATLLSGQVPHLRAAIARRLREGGPPSFPPGPRDALVLGGTVLTMLESERGLGACAALIAQTRPGHDRAALEEVFGRPLAALARGWADYLEAFTAG